MSSLDFGFIRKISPAKYLKIFLFALLIFSVFSFTALATTQNLINVQGKAVNKTTGTLILVGNVSVRIYAAPDNGTAAHSETFTNVITNGTFSVQVGNSTALNLTYNQIYWLEIDVNGEEVVGNATGAAGRRAFISQAGPDNTIIYANDTSRNVGVNITNPGGIFQVSAGGTSTALFVNGTTGYVGVGTASPNTNLNIAGSINISGSINGTFNGIPIATNFINVNGIPQANLTGLTIPAANVSSGQFASGLFTFQNNLTVAQNLTAGNTLWIDSALNRVGIGTTSPQSKLEIKATGSVTYNAADQVRINSGTSGNRAELHFTDGITSDAYISFLPSATAASRRLSLSASPTEADFVIQGNGNVGIGTTSPGYTLDVQRAGNARFFNIAPSSTTTGYVYAAVNNTGNEMFLGVEGSAAGSLFTNSLAYAGLIGSNNAKALQLGTNGAVGVTILSGGNVGIATVAPVSEFEVNGTAPTISLQNGTLSGRINFDVNATGDLIVNSSSTNNILAVQKGGNVGIGTTGPAQLLQVLKSQDTLTGISLSNTNTGTAAQTSYALTNNDGTSYLYQFGSGYTTNGRFIQNSVLLEAFGAGGLSLSAAHASGPIRFYAGGTSERVRIDTTGNVGINTTTPSGLLQVNVNGSDVFHINETGRVGIGTAGPDKTLTLLAASGGGLDITIAGLAHGMTDELPTNAYAYLRDANSGDGGLILMGASDAAGISGLTLMGLIGVADPTDTIPVIILEGSKKSGTTRAAVGALETAIQMRTGSTNLVTILGSGNVGIGTTTPDVKLQVDAGNVRFNTSSTLTSPHLLLMSPSGGGESQANDGIRIQRYTISSTNGTAFTQLNTWGGTSELIAYGGGTNYGGMNFVRYNNTTFTTSMAIDSSGNVGINTTAPSYTLDVAGNLTVWNGTLYENFAASDDNLSGYFPFSEGIGTTTYDRSPYGVDGTLANGPVWNSSGFAGSGLSFDGINDVVNAGQAMPTANASAFTLEGWANLASLGNYRTIVGTTQSSAQIGFDSINRIICGRNGGGGWFIYGPTAVANRWYHIACIYNGTHATLFADGVLVAGPTAGVFADHTTTNIGAYNAAGGEPFNGTIDEVRIYRRMLSINEIRSHYLRGLQSYGNIRANYFKVVNLTGNANFAVMANGSVGIGTTAPLSALNVVGTTGISWGSNANSKGLVTIGTPLTGGSLFINTPSAFALYSSGLGVTGTYSVPKSVININAYGVNDASYNADLAFSTTNGTTLTEWMRITNTGNVGIGTATPNLDADTTPKLVVVADEGATINQNEGQFIIAGSTNTNKRLNIGFQTTGNYGFLQAGIKATGSNPIVLQPEGGNVGIGTTTPAYKLEVNGNASLGSTLYVNNSNVGIGTTAPQDNLHVSGSVNLGDIGAGMLINNVNGAQGSISHLKFSVTDAPTNYQKAGIFFKSNAGGSGLGDLHLAVDSAADSGNVDITDSKITILQGGNVGIGQTLPSTKLEVAGGIAINQSSFYEETFHKNVGGTGGNGTIVQFNVSNPTYADIFYVEVIAINSRAGVGGSGIGTSQVAKKTFAVARDNNRNVALSTLVGAGEYELTTADAGGGLNGNTMTLNISRAGSETNTSMQQVNINATTGLSGGATSNIIASIRVVGSSRLTIA